jgi:NitT/TauT family transport system substrate-binding protein
LLCQDRIVYKTYRQSQLRPGIRLAGPEQEQLVHTPHRNRHRSLAATVLLIAVAFVAAAGCSSDATTASAGPGPGGTSAPTTVRLGYFANITHAPALVGIQKGFFKEKLGKHTLEPKVFDAGPAAIEAMNGEALDITYIGPNPSINSYQKSNGESVRIVAGSTSGGAALVTKPEITKAEDLKGKTVASPQLGNTQDVALRSWLKGKGLVTDTSGGGDVSIKPQANADTLTAFKDGTIAGAWVPEPWATRLVQEGGGKVLVDEKTLWPDGKFDTTNILVSKKFLDAHPDIVKQVLEAHLQALDFIKANPAEAQAAANAEIKDKTKKELAEKVITESWKHLEFTYDPIASSVQKSATDAKDVGQLKTDDIKNIYALDILNDLLKAKSLPAVKGLT